MKITYSIVLFGIKSFNNCSISFLETGLSLPINTRPINNPPKALNNTVGFDCGNSPNLIPSSIYVVITV